jgi:hypothetical protein
LTDPERKEITREGVRALKSAAHDWAQMQADRAQGRAVAARLLNPRKAIHEGVAGAVKKYLDPKQIDRYEAEALEQSENLREVAVNNTIANLDQELFLTADQREKLHDSLCSYWTGIRAQQLEMLGYGSRIGLGIPDQYIFPYLTETQRDVWRATRTNNMMILGAGGIATLMLDADPLEGEDASGNVESPQGQRQRGH